LTRFCRVALRKRVSDASSSASDDPLSGSDSPFEEHPWRKEEDAKKINAKKNIAGVFQAILCWLMFFLKDLDLMLMAANDQNKFSHPQRQDYFIS
jgi:hypothetical protein